MARATGSLIQSEQRMGYHPKLDVLIKRPLAYKPSTERDL